MAFLSKNKANVLLGRMPDLRRFASRSFRKQTAICPFIITRGVMNSTEAGYPPQGAEPRDFTDFEQVIEGFDPIIVQWEDGVTFPFDGTLDQRYQKAPKVKVRGSDGLVSAEPKKVYPIGSVFQYEDGTEFKLPRLWWDENLGWLDGIPAYNNGLDPRKMGRWETDEEYQARFKEELGRELDRLAKPENKKKDKYGV